MQDHIRSVLYLFLVVLVSCAASSRSGLAQQNGSFEGRLILEDVAEEYTDTGRYDPGHTEFMLLEDYTFVDGDNRRWTAPKGTVVDGASIPKVVWSVVGGPWSGKYRNAAVIHDYMCEMKIEDSKFTHLTFYHAMIAGGVDKRKANILYYAVLRGGPSWTKEDKKRPEFSPYRGTITMDDLQEFSRILDGSTLTPDEIYKLANQASAQ